MIYPTGKKINEASITETIYRTEDGATLPLRRWLPATPPMAVIIALHGFNDYSNFFDKPGLFFSSQGIASYAYDQRGFGSAPRRGYWAGIPTYTNDLRVFAKLVKQHHPNLPIYLLGESMGGAIVITSLSQAPIPEIDGVILSAPALWARKTMPWYQTSLLWMLAHTFPKLTLTGNSIGVKASDNIEMLRALGRDPLIIKSTRVEAIYGLTNLMDIAYANPVHLQKNTLILYGANDELVPKKPTYDFLKRFLETGGENNLVAYYQQGYHMLLRDLNANVTLNDITTWIKDKKNPLPSGADHNIADILNPLKISQN